MPFAESNQRNAQNLKMYASTFTGLPGDASGTITLSGGLVYGVFIQNQDGDTPKEMPQADVSVSGSTITVTIHNHMDVTNGRILIFYA